MTGTVFNVEGTAKGLAELRQAVGSDLERVNGRYRVINAYHNFRKHPALNSAFKDRILQHSFLNEVQHGS
jgi:hypothetical protein